MVKEFERTFVGSVNRIERIKYLRDVYEYKLGNPGDDVISHLIQSDLTRAEVEGLIYVFFTSGRDSVAYMISTGMLALLQNPEQLSHLRMNLPVSHEAIEELMRYCAMFVTLFPAQRLKISKYQVIKFNLAKVFQFHLSQQTETPKYGANQILLN